MQPALNLKHTHPEDPVARMDRFGIGLSTLCAIHCAATPILMGVLPSIANVFAHGAFHIITFIMLVGIAALTLVRTFFQHRRFVPLAIGLLGIALAALGLAADELFPHAHAHSHAHASGELPMEEILTFVGSMFLIVAHWKNRTVCTRKECTHP